VALPQLAQRSIGLPSLSLISHRCPSGRCQKQRTDAQLVLRLETPVSKSASSSFGWSGAAASLGSNVTAVESSFLAAHMSPRAWAREPALPRRFPACPASSRAWSLTGPELAVHAFEAGLVDELHLFLAPIVVGGGKQSLPDSVRLKLELLDERPFGNGMVHLRYRTRPPIA
jgi:hypothetical protein